MYRKILLICLAYMVFFSSAIAHAQQFTIDFSIYHDGDTAAETVLLDTDSSRVRIFSSLFPGCFLTGSFSGLETLFSLTDIPNDVPSFSVPDIQSILTAWNSARNPLSHTGFFSGDAFDHAVSVTYGTCSARDILTLASSLSGCCFPVLSEKDADGILKVLSEYGIISVSENNDILYRIFDGGKYFSLTRESCNSVIRTASYDFSEEKTTRAVFGYADRGKNYYWTVESILISPQELILSACFRSDPEKTGYRTIMNKQPIIQESWRFVIPENRSSIAFTGSIDPQNELDDILISGAFQLSEERLFYAEFRFSSNQEIQNFTLSVQKSKNEISSDSLQEIQISDLLTSGRHDAFSEEIVDGMARIYSAIIKYVPLDYTVRLMNLFD